MANLVRSPQLKIAFETDWTALNPHWSSKTVQFFRLGQVKYWHIQNLKWKFSSTCLGHFSWTQTNVAWQFQGCCSPCSLNKFLLHFVMVFRRCDNTFNQLFYVCLFFDITSHGYRPSTIITYVMKIYTDFNLATWPS